LVNMSEIVEKTKNMSFGIGTAIIDVESTGFAFLDVWNKLVNADNAVSIIWAVDGNMKDVVYRCFQETDEIFVSLDTSAGELNHAISSSFSRYIMRKSSLQQINDLKDRQKLLSPRQKEVFYYLNRGLRNTEIAYLMKMRADTVKEYKKIIFQKLGIQNSMDFLRYRGLLDKIGTAWNRTPNAGSDAPDGRDG